MRPFKLWNQTFNRRKMLPNGFTLPRLLIIANCFNFAAIYCMNSASTRCPDKCTCSTNFRRITCEHQGLYAIPKDIPDTATLLYLGYNKLAEIDTGSFATLRNLTELSLLNNRITNIQNRSFVGLRNLKSLTLRRNKLVSIARDAFWDLVSLQKLYLTDNLFTSIPDLTFAPNLIYLTVDTNYLESASLCNNSANFSKLSTIKLANNANITQISTDDFKCVNRMSVRSIDISRCSVTSFSHDVFSFPHLQSLSLSYNSIPYDMLERIFRSIVPSDLTSLDLSGVLQPTDVMPSDLFASLIGLKLNHLSLAHTSGVSVIQNGTFQYFPHLKILDLSHSDFTAIFDSSLSSLTNLTRISLNHNRNIHDIPALNSSSLEFLELDNNPQIEKLPNRIFSGLVNLKNLTLQKCGILTIYKHSFSGLANLKTLNLARNRISGSAFPSRALGSMQSLQVLDISSNKLTFNPTQYDLFAGLGQLERLDFSNNLCKNVSTRIFQPLTNLKFLDLTGNSLGELIALDKEGQLFNHLNKLKYLGLAGNRIPVVPERLLASLDNLERLNLSNNLLTFWPPGMVKKFAPLDIIDFSSNKIAIVDKGELLTLPDGTRLDLMGNPFACGCDLIWFSRWIRQENSSDDRLIGLPKYKCNSPDAMAGRPLVQFNPDDIEGSCYQLPIKWILSGSISGLFAVMLFFAGVGYRYRWPLRKHLYYFKRRFKSPTDLTWRSENDDDFEYDIFVSYGPADRDRTWVKSQLMPRFVRDHENQNAVGQSDNDDNADNVDNADSESQPLMVPDGPDGDVVEAGGDSHNQVVPILGRWKVFIEEEGATFGQLEFNTLAESIFKSRKVILVVSDEYLSDGRRLVEIDLAVKSRIDSRLSFDSIIVVFLDPDADVKGTRTLISIVDKKDRLYWTDDDQAGQELFWQQLAEAIQSRPDVTLLPA